MYLIIYRHWEKSANYNRVIYHYYYIILITLNLNWKSLLQYMLRIVMIGLDFWSSTCYLVETTREVSPPHTVRMSSSSPFDGLFLLMVLAVQGPKGLKLNRERDICTDNHIPDLARRQLFGPTYYHLTSNDSQISNETFWIFNANNSTCGKFVQNLFCLINKILSEF